MNEYLHKQEQKQQDRANFDVLMMRLALEQASIAASHGEVPVGAVLVLNDEVIGKGFNQNIMLNDPSAHAEMIAIKQGAAEISNYRIPNACLYVTLEPCAMCAGLLVHSRISRLVVGAPDSKTGACGSVLNVINEIRFNHQISYTQGVLEGECSKLLKDFFAHRRAEKKALKLNKNAEARKL